MAVANQPSSPGAATTGERPTFEGLLAQLYSRFIAVPADQIDPEIEDALRRVCGLFRLDVGVVWQWNVGEGDVIRPTHLHAPAAGLSFEPLDQAAFPWVVQEMRAGRVVAVSRLDQLPAEAQVDRENARRSGIQSSLTLPLTLGGEPPVGALVFNTVQAPRDWSGEDVARLTTLAQVLTGALARKRADFALRESEARCRATFEQAAVGIAHVATDGRLLRVNTKFCDIVGYSREQLLQMTFQQFTHPDDLALDLANVGEVLAGQRDTYTMEKRYIRRDGTIVWANLTVSLLLTADGEPRHFIAVIEDVTPRRRDEAALRLSETRLSAAAHLAGLAFYELDYGKATSFVDERFRTLCGLPPDLTQGLRPVEFWQDHLHPDDRAVIAEGRERMHAGGLDRFEMEYRYLQPSGELKWIHHLACVAERDAAGRARRTYGVFHDVTTRRQAEEALRQNLAEIERLKDRLQAETDYLRAEIGVALNQSEITGSSPVVKRVLRLAQQVAPTDSTVLIRGETGTGKELLAQAIHRLSSRHHRVMVKVNCAALPSGLVESELFGREKGAFTGALTRQVGRFEVADGSTLFLDEVGELPLEVQAKLLRVLQEGEFERLGSPRTVKVNVRMIAATNRDLADDVRKGRFREDLYYRLNVFPVRVPSLRERAEDIPLLVWTFLEEFSSRMGKKITQVPRPVMDELMRRPWPGNVRELRNVIEHAAIITTGATLRVPPLVDAAPAATSLATLVESERAHIQRVLDSTGGRIKGPQGAAAVLGLNPATLYSRMKRLGMQRRRKAEPAS